MVKPYYQRSVSTTPVMLAVSNRNRTSLFIWNDDSATTLYIGFDRLISIFDGMPVPPKSGLSFVEGLGDRPDLEMWGKTGGGSIDIRITEATKPEGSA